MAVTVDVPTSISIDQMRTMLACIGLDHLMPDLRSFTADLDGIHVTVIARDADGKMYSSGNTLAEHTISIKLDR